MRRNALYICLLVLWMLCLLVAEGQADVLVPEADVAAAVRAFARKRVAGFDGDVTLSVRHTRDITVKGAGPVTLRVFPTKGRDRQGSVSGILEIRRGPVCVERHPVSADVTFYDDVAVADREILRDEPLTEAAVRFERRDVTRRLGRYVGSAEQLDGMRARSRISAGRLLDPRLMEQTPAVERRDQVRIEAVVGGVRAVVLGTADEAGAVGDRITVQNLESRERLLAEIVAPGVVRVVF
jgi:flagella basal body P-ring formation protein FlgA